ncbi:hypothetical protein, partial [uncultured Bacteroides sp.]|uniref:hypothetical protein n=1 Tax=uncultured Bacteroides sp. TaxID=162156 RepID=UPI002608BD5B
LFGFGRSSDKLHSLGPKNIRRTSEETPKKLRSKKGPEKTPTGKTGGDAFGNRKNSCVNIYKHQFLLMETDLRLPSFI